MEYLNNLRKNGLPKELKDMGIKEEILFSRKSICERANSKGAEKPNGADPKQENSSGQKEQAEKTVQEVIEKHKADIMAAIARLEEDNKKLRQEIDELKRKMGS